MVYLIFLVIPLVGIIMYYDHKRDERKEAKRKVAETEVEKFNKSAAAEIIHYDEKYHIRRQQREMCWSGTESYPFYLYCVNSGGITIPKKDRWDYRFSHAKQMNTLEEAKELLASLSIEYISPNKGEVVYKEETPEALSKDLILELIKAVENQDKEKEIEILHALGHKI